MRISRPISSALTALTLMLCQTADSSAEPKNAWVLVKPGAETQVQKSVQERGGINPCMTEDPGFGAYEPWRRGLPIGQLLAPRTWRAKGAFDVVFHFHGHEAARKEWVRVMDGPVLVGIDLGNGSGPYDHYFSSPDAFRELVAATERDARPVLQGWQRESRPELQAGIEVVTAVQGFVQAEPTIGIV